MITLIEYSIGRFIKPFYCHDFTLKNLPKWHKLVVTLLGSCSRANTTCWGFELEKAEYDLPEEIRAVGVVKRSDAPLIEKLLSENDHPSYHVALVETSSVKRWVPHLIGIPLIMSLFSILDTIKITR